MHQRSILVVDDVPQNTRLLEAVLVPRGYRVLIANSGEEALEIVERDPPDLVLLDIQMPGIDGYETARRLRDREATFALPIIMITASGESKKLEALDSGADDFVAKPFDQTELLARVKSLLRIKTYHDTIRTQSADLERWAMELDKRVRSQVGELERANRLRRFLSPQLAEIVVSEGEGMLEAHRKEIAVLFCDLRGFTAFSEEAEPEEIMVALTEYHGAVGRLVGTYEATVGDFAGDSVLVYWNDPVPCPDPTERAIRFARDLVGEMSKICARWQKVGHDLDVGVGIAFGYATLGTIGFEGRMDYKPVGSVVNLAARLCSEAGGCEILMSPRAFAAIEELVETEQTEPLDLKGFRRPVRAHRLIRVTEPATPPADPAGVAP